MKRETLVEITEYVNTPVGQKIFTESLMPDIVEMVRVNILRALPPVSDDFDPEEDEPSLEPAWPHLQVYILYLCICVYSLCVQMMRVSIYTYVLTSTLCVYISSYIIHIYLYALNIYNTLYIQIVYEFFLRFIVSSEVSGKVSKKYVDQNFIRQWIELFDAEDPRERDYVKTVLHRMYGKFMSYRSYIRKAISQVFFQYIYETGRSEL